MIRIVKAVPTTSSSKPSELWAKITGQPVTPFVMRMDPRTGFGRVYRGAQGAAPPPSPGPPQPPGSPRTDDVTDVEVKEIRDPRA